MERDTLRNKWLVLVTIAVLASSNSGRIPTLHAQVAPVGAGFTLDAGDLRFIFHQIEIAQAHAAGGQLFGPGPNQVPEVRLPFGLRTVDGSFNHLETDQLKFGAADELFPRLVNPPVFRQAEQGSSYQQTAGTVFDTQPRIISNLIVDQTSSNPAAAIAAGIGAEFVDENLNGVLDPGETTFFIPNSAPDVGLSAPFNQMFTFFGQFFDHGLDLVNKGGNGVVFVALREDDPLRTVGRDGIPETGDEVPAELAFMPVTRATMQPGPDRVLGTADDIHEAINQTTPFVDQNQTYTSHPSHQVFLRQYAPAADNPATPAIERVTSTGKMLDGALAGNIGNWGEVKAQALSMLGIALQDSDVFAVPQLLTDPYGRFVPGNNGYAQLVTAGGLVEGTAVGVVPSAVGALRTGHAFLDDIAHSASPHPGLPADDDNVITNPPTPGTYDDELLNIHFVTGDGRGNENIALTAVHTIFHSEHNRLATQIGGGPGIPALIDTLLSAQEAAAWRAVDPASGWNFGERVFQAARFVTEMQYQHLVFEEFARKLVPSINEFIGDGVNFQSDTNPAIVAEFAHQVYRLGHSMLTETIRRTDVDTVTRQIAVDAAGEPITNDVSLITAFLNPQRFNECLTPGVAATCRYPTAAAAAGAIFQGNTREIGNEIDEFVTDAVRNNLLGLPLDLAVFNLARGRSEGIPPLNAVRRALFAATSDAALTPYQHWLDFQLASKHPESVVNYIAAYGTHPSVAGPDRLRGTVDDPTPAVMRANALLIVHGGVGAPTDRFDFLFSEGAWINDPATGATITGVDNIDLWIGGLAEKIAPFGSMLGTTFNHVFEIQLENLQNADRFYYLERLDGLNLLNQMENNSFSALIMRNVDTVALAGDVFSRPDLVFNVRSLGTSGPILDDLSTPDVDEALMEEQGELRRMPDGTIRYTGPLHAIWNGTDENGDRLFSSEGDDTLHGAGGDDTMEGGAGNDSFIGGDGDDVLTDLFGEDNIKGGAGNDAISSGSGPFDLVLGGAGHDFIVAGNDVTETFGGPGNDIMYTGAGATEAFGGAGDDWIEGGPQLDLLVGDENNQFQDDPNQGDDVIIGNKGDDDYDSEGGNDIMVADVLGTERLEGMLGFDWVTYRGDAHGVDADMNIRVVLPPNLDELRDRFDLVEALSGWNFNDVLRGEDSTVAELAADTNGDGIAGDHALTAQGIARIQGLSALLGGATSFAAGNIILGGSGSDLIEGRGGDDVIDGDAWLNVQLGVLNLATPDPNDFSQFADRLNQLRTAVFARQINPGNIRIVRSIVVDANVPPADCTSALPLNCDTALFSDVVANYVITQVSSNPNVWTVSHVGGTAADGTDTLRRMERAQFADAIVDLTGGAGNSPATGTVTINDTTPTEDQVLTATATIADGNGFNAANVVLTFEAQTAPGVFTPVGTGATFQAGDPQVGQALRVVARFIDNAGFSERIVSAVTAAVANVNDVPVGAAVLSQPFPQEAESLSVNPTTILDGDGLVGVTFGFQWQRSTALGVFNNNSNILGATGPAYTPVQGDVGRLLRVSVTFTDNHGTAEAVLSAASAEVGDVFVGTANADDYTGTAGRDNVSGLGGPDTIQTGGADDVVSGGAGNDTINTGGGNDIVTGGAGDDNIGTGAENDIIRFSGANTGFDTVTGGAGVDEIQALAANTVIGLAELNGIESITGSGFANVTILGSDVANVFNFSVMTVTGIAQIDGGGGPDEITGSAQADVIFGSAGGDTLLGQGGNDVLNGGAGADTINGNAGNDDITGGPGNDTLNGGGGANIFRLVGNFDADSIAGFDANPANGQDTLNVSALGITAANFAARVTIVAAGTNTTITVRNADNTIAGTVTLVNVVAATVTVADFTLAP